MKAIVLGASGMTGRAVAMNLVGAGWQVLGTGRDRKRFPADLVASGVGFVESDRHVRHELDAVLVGGADVGIDCVCYTAEQASWLLDHRDHVGSAVMVSSKAVYTDTEGRHSGTAEPPDFGGPVAEDQSTVEPDFSGDYDSPDGYGANKVAAEQILLDSGWPVSVLRPSRIHGVGAARPREWFVLRRILDGRTAIPLAHGGLTANHPTAASNLASLAAFCAHQPGTRVLNIADPDTPTAADVVRAIAHACGVELTVAGLPDAAPVHWGRNPWDTWPPTCWTSLRPNGSATNPSAPTPTPSGPRSTGFADSPQPSKIDSAGTRTSKTASTTTSTTRPCSTTRPPPDLG